MTAAAKVVSDAIGNATNQVSIVTQCVNACRSHFGGDVPLKEDCADFANKVAEYRGWSEASAKARKSEVRKVVRNYGRLDSACKAVAKASESFTWHNAVKVARLLNKMPKASDTAIVRAYFESPPSNAQTPTEKSMRLIKNFINVKGRKSADVIALRTAVEKVCADRGIEI